MNATLTAAKKSDAKPSPLRAMIRKEWRQNIAWALLGAIGFGLALSVTLRDAYYTPTDFALHAYWLAALKACTLAAPVMGFLLGLLQILPEKRRDLWSFLIHRPVSPRLLFAGKALAGSALYAVAMGIPIAGAVWYAAAPGHLNGPFDPRMALGCFGAAIAGWPCYFAGLLVALRPARWYGSRILPLVAALSLPFLNGAGAIPEFWQVAAFSLIISAIYVIAGYGAFAGTGEFERQSRLTINALAIVLWASTGLAYLAAAASPVLPGIMGPKSLQLLEQFNILSDGRLVLISPSSQTSAVWACDRNGVLLDGNRRMLGPAALYPITPDLREPVSLPYTEVNLYPYTVSSDPYQIGGSQYGYPDASARPISDDPGAVTWYFGDRSRQLLGYQDNKLVSVAGPNGFFTPERRSEASLFDKSPLVLTSMIGANRFLMRQGARLLAVSLDTRSVQPLTLPIAADDVRSTAIWPAYRTPKSDMRKSDSGMPAYAIVARDAIYFMNRANSVLFTVARQFPESRYPTVSVTALPRDGREYILYQTPEGDGFGPGQMSILDGSGREVASIPIPKVGPAPLWNQDEMRQPSAEDAVVCPITLAVFAAQGYGHALIENKRAVRELIVCMAAAIAWALCGLLIARRWGLRWTACIPWAIAAFLLGIPGVIAQLALRGYPARVPCPSCKNPRAATEELCEYCGAPFPEPETNGTEIFGDIHSAALMDIAHLPEKDLIR